MQRCTLWKTTRCVSMSAFFTFFSRTAAVLPRCWLEPRTARAHTFEWIELKCYRGYRFFIPDFRHHFSRKKRKKRPNISFVIILVFLVKILTSSRSWSRWKFARKIEAKLFWDFLLSIGYFLPYLVYSVIYIYRYIFLSLRTETRVYSTYQRRSVIIVINGISNVCARY